MLINDANALIAQIRLLETQFEEVKDAITAFAVKYGLTEAECVISVESPREYLERLVIQAEENKRSLQSRINEPDRGLAAELQGLETQKDKLIASADSEEKRYQKYLSDLDEWNRKRSEINENPPSAAK